MVIDNVNLIALHRYYIWANRLRELYVSTLATHPQINEQNYITWFADDPGLLMSHWYAALYVVVEGYVESCFQDAIIDDMLISKNVDLLKRYRHGVCHFQEKYFDGRFTDFMGSPDSAQWVGRLNEEFGRFFLEQLALC